MNREEAIEQLQICKGLIKQDGKDWLDERDIPLLELAIEALQAPTGEWIGLYECSVCGKQAFDFIEGYVEGVEYLPNYCPNCGARMKGGAG